MARKKTGEVRKRTAAGRGKLPVKRTINLAQAGVKKMNTKAAVLGILLIAAAAFAFGKFAVADRLISMSREQRKVSELQGQLDTTYAKIASYGEVEDEYAHYTYAGMTDEELSAVDRGDVIALIEKEIGTGERSDSWSLTGNVLTLSVHGKNLQEVNLLARQLESNDLVSLCTVTNAVKENKTDETAAAEGPVRANIIAYLAMQEEGEKK